MNSSIYFNDDLRENSLKNSVAVKEGNILNTQTGDKPFVRNNSSIMAATDSDSNKFRRLNK